MLERSEVLSAAEQRTLRQVVSHIVPASAEFKIPGADDDRIFADILASLGRDAPAVRQALQRIADLAGTAFIDLPMSRQQDVLATLSGDHPAAAAVLYAVTVQRYYRDDRILASLGLEPRPPFPRGYDLPAADLSILDPVRARGPIYRDPAARAGGHLEHFRVR